MIKLFHIPSHSVETSAFSHALHSSDVEELEIRIAKYVGAKYACATNSATSAIFLALQQEDTEITIPSLLPPVVANAIITSGNRLRFNDNTAWVGHCYELHNLGSYKIFDSAQQLERQQFKKIASPSDIMIFSFYPTKPLSGLDGGLVVSDDKDKIEWFKCATLNGMSYAENNWDRQIKFPGWKMYLSSFQAAIINSNFKTYNSKTEKLKRLRDHYNVKLGLNNTSSHLYRVKVVDNQKSLATLAKDGIQCGIHYKCLHSHPIYSTEQNLINSTALAKQTLSLPFHEKLSLKDADQVIKKISPLLTHED